MALSKFPTPFPSPTTPVMTMKSPQKLVVSIRFIDSVCGATQLIPFDLSARHQASMLRSLKEVQADDSVIGFYQATTLGAFFNQTLVDTQAIHQDKLRHGGIVIVHGKHGFSS
jgi:hypothetical protein